MDTTNTQLYEMSTANMWNHCDLVFSAHDPDRAIAFARAYLDEHGGEDMKVMFMSEDGTKSSADFDDLSTDCYWCVVSLYKPPTAFKADVKVEGFEDVIVHIVHNWSE